MLPKSGNNVIEAQEVDGLKQAIQQEINNEKQQRRRKAKLNVLHSVYYTYKLRYHTEPHNVYEMIKGVAYLLEG